MSTTPPQFGTAEYKSAGGETCRACNQAMSGEYYRINGVQACTNCTDKLKAQVPKDSHAAFVRGILFGAGGAIVGLIVYSAFGIITGLMIGYVSLAVGWLVGKAIKMGSKGVGGRRYQIVALVFTYAAVSLSAIPIGIAQFVKSEKNKVVTSKQPAPDASSRSGTDGSQPDAGTGANSAAKTPEPNKKVSVGAAIGALLFAGLASPFLELADEPGGIIGLVILVVGLNIAWKLTAAPKLEILGPFKANAPVPAAG